MLRKLHIFVYTLLLSSSQLFANTTVSRKDKEELSKAVAENRKAEGELSKAVAENRAQKLSDVAYDMFFDLSDPQSSSFKGQVAISFQLSNNNEPLTIDFYQGEIEQVQLNQKTIDTEYNGFFISLPASQLNKGTNVVTINFTHEYSKNGDGLYKFLDPIDNKVYMYTDFEPYDANKMFPSFDQPDVKATYKLRVKAPKSFQVIANAIETKVDKSKNYSLWHFPKTKPFSTYIFALHAGPYKKWEENFRVPLRLFARQSLAKFVNPDHWFPITKSGFDYFDKYFAIDYPYGKYDQIIVPDFNAGAMENVGAVTFSERYLKRGKMERAHTRRLANTILHELAHMWFGNLVTMKWWDDLWLNESFATFMAAKAMTDATEYKESWELFNKRSKVWSYRTDELRTTHPMSAIVPDTSQATANFDAITYGKGASVLRQLEFLLGEEQFREGLRIYFKKHQNSNTTLSDFMNSLSAASKRDLKQFRTDYIELAGVNTVQAEFSCKDNKIKYFNLKQGYAGNKQPLREHRTQIALLGHSQQDLSVNHSIAVTYKGDSTSVPELIGLNCPKLVYPNHDSFDYVKVILDPRSQSVALQNLDSIKDSFIRGQVLASLEDSVRNASLSVYKLSSAVRQQLRVEQDIQIVRQLISILNNIKYYELKAAENWQDELMRLSKIEADLFQYRLSKAKPGEDLQMIWFDNWLQVANLPSDILVMKNLFLGDSKIKGLKIDSDRKWQIVHRLSVLGDKETTLYQLKMKTADQSHRGKLSFIKAELHEPYMQKKLDYTRQAIDPKSSLTAAERKTITRSIYSYEFPQFKNEFSSELVGKLPVMIKGFSSGLTARMLRSLLPKECTNQSVVRISQLLKSNTYAPSIKKVLINAEEQDERCVRIVKLAKSSKKLGH